MKTECIPQSYCLSWPSHSHLWSHSTRYHLSSILTVLLSLLPWRARLGHQLRRRLIQMRILDFQIPLGNSFRRSSASGLWSPEERKWSLAVWGLLLGLRGRLGASPGRLYVNEGPERANASWFQVATTTTRQKPPKRVEFIHQQDRAGFWTLAKRSKTPLLLGG